MDKQVVKKKVAVSKETLKKKVPAKKEKQKTRPCWMSINIFIQMNAPSQAKGLSAA